MAAEANAIDAASIAAGVELCRWFGHEAKRVYAILGENEDQRERRRRLELIERRGGEVSVRDWQRARSHRNAKDTETELTEFETAGWGYWVEPDTWLPRGPTIEAVRSDPFAVQYRPDHGSQPGTNWQRSRF